MLYIWYKGSWRLELFLRNGSHPHIRRFTSLPNSLCVWSYEEIQYGFLQAESYTSGSWLLPFFAWWHSSQFSLMLLPTGYFLQEYGWRSTVLDNFSPWYCFCSKSFITYLSASHFILQLISLSWLIVMPIGLVTRMMVVLPLVLVFFLVQINWHWLPRNNPLSHVLLPRPNTRFFPIQQNSDGCATFSWVGHLSKIPTMW